MVPRFLVPAHRHLEECTTAVVAAGGQRPGAWESPPQWPFNLSYSKPLSQAACRALRRRLRGHVTVVGSLSFDLIARCCIFVVLVDSELDAPGQDSGPATASACSHRPAHATLVHTARVCSPQLEVCWSSNSARPAHACLPAGRLSIHCRRVRRSQASTASR
jgi:hypothetical protein